MCVHLSLFVFHFVCILPLKLANIKCSCNFQCSLLSLTRPLVMGVKLWDSWASSRTASKKAFSLPASLLPLTELWLRVGCLGPLQSWFCSGAKLKLLHCWKSLLQLMWGRGTGRENWDSQREETDTSHFQQQWIVRWVWTRATKVLLQTVASAVQEKADRCAACNVALKTWP